eukprot:Rhum_TRINITY_DN14969_c8_g7::Rhum_TRINITY_DN14969_c8_g7_i2::g.130646::m.130646
MPESAKQRFALCFLTPPRLLDGNLRFNNPLPFLPSFLPTPRPEHLCLTAPRWSASVLCPVPHPPPPPHSTRCSNAVAPRGGPSHPCVALKMRRSLLALCTADAGAGAFAFAGRNFDRGDRVTAQELVRRLPYGDDRAHPRPARVPRVADAVEQLRREGREVGCITYERAASLAAQLDEYGECQAFVDALKEEFHAKPSARVYLSLLRAYGRNGRLSDVKRVFREYEAAGYPVENGRVQTAVMAALRGYSKTVQEAAAALTLEDKFDAARHGALTAAARQADAAVRRLFHRACAGGAVEVGPAMVNAALPASASWSEAVSVVTKYRFLLPGAAEDTLPPDTLCALMECCGAQEDLAALDAVYSKATEGGATPVDAVVLTYLHELGRCCAVVALPPHCAALAVARCSRLVRRATQACGWRRGRSDCASVAVLAKLLRVCAVQVAHVAVFNAQIRDARTLLPCSRSEALVRIALAVYPTLPSAAQKKRVVQRAMRRMHEILGNSAHVVSSFADEPLRRFVPLRQK